MNSYKVSLSVLATAIALALAACGGGGGDDDGVSPTSPTTPTTPTVPTSVPPATDVPTPTYPSTDARAQVFQQLNDFRAAIGVGKLAQDPLLDVAAQAHADYLKLNSVINHDEVSTNPGYYEATPRSRATKAGVNPSQWIAEVAGPTTILQPSWAAVCMRMTNSVYHLQALTSQVETVGIGINDWTCTIDMAVVTGVSGTPGDNSVPIGGGQQMAADSIGVAPVEGSTVDGAMPAESPQPAPDIASPGHPLMVRVRADNVADALTVSSFTLVDNVGSTIPGRVLIASNAQAGTTVSGAQVDSLLDRGVVFFMPLAPLASGTSYTATFAGARNGTPISKSWSFATN